VTELVTLASIHVVMLVNAACVCAYSCCLPSYHAAPLAVTAVAVEAALRQASASIYCVTVWRCPFTRYRFVRLSATRVSDTPSGRSPTVDWTTAIGLAKPSTSFSGMNIFGHCSSYTSSSTVYKDLILFFLVHHHAAADWKFYR